MGVNPTLIIYKFQILTLKDSNFGTSKKIGALMMLHYYFNSLCRLLA